MFARQKILHELHDVIENDRFWIGWMRFESYSDIMRFLWIYTHQTKTVYTIKNKQAISGSIQPLRYKQWSNDHNINDKYVQHIQTIKYICQRSNTRGQRAESTTNNAKHFSMQTNCHCHINIKIYQITHSPTHTTKSTVISYIAVISDNHITLHTHDTNNWENRATAPLPTQLQNKIRDIIQYNPNLSMFKTVIKRYMRDKNGLRYDIFNDIKYEPCIDDPCINITDENRLKYQFYKVLKNINGINKKDQELLVQYISDLKSDDEKFDDGDLVYYCPYRRYEADEKLDNEYDIDIVTAENPRNKQETVRYRPFVLVYQNKHMRECTMQYGINIVSMDSTHSTTKYGFKVFAIVTLDEFRNTRTCGTFIVQHETIEILTLCISKIVEHMKTQGFHWKPRIFIIDKSDAEKGAITNALPETLQWLCWVHVDRTWDEKLCTFTGKRDAMVIKRLLEKMKYCHTEETALKTRDIILNHILVIDDQDFIRYLKTEWFQHMKMWCNCYRQFYHKNIDTTNISESWNNKLKRLLSKTNPNKLVCSVFKTIVEDLLWVEKYQTRSKRYKQSNLWRAPSIDFYPDLQQIEYENRPKRVISEIRSNKLKSQIIEYEQIHNCSNTTDIIYEVSRTTHNKLKTHTVNITNGYCNCHYFIHNQIPCIDMFAIFRHINHINFSNLPQQLLYAENMIINTSNIPPPVQYDTNTIDIPQQIDVPTSQIDIPSQNIPHTQSYSKTLKKYQTNMINTTSNIQSLLYALDSCTIDNIHRTDPEIASDLNNLYFRILQHVPHTPDGIPIFPTNTSYHRPPSKRQRVQAQQQLIPHKPATKAQERAQQTLKQKRQRLKAQRKTAPNVSLPAFIEKEQEREKRQEEHTKEVIREREKEWRKVPVYYRESVDMDMNDTISNNDDNHNRKSHRMIKPSKAMINHNKYIFRAAPGHMDVIGMSDDDE